MKKLSALGTIIILSLGCTFGQSLSPKQEALLVAKGDTLLKQGISFGEHVGWAAGVYADGKIMWEGGAGLRNMDEGLAANEDMIHRIASIAKPMTAIAILQLVEQGKIDLDVPIQTYVPEFPKKTEGTITVRHLLTHSSGINAYKGMLDGFTFKEYPTLLDAMGRFQKRKLVGEPGKVYQYTTYGYVVLGVIIEKVSGMRYESYMKQHIWEPAGMYHTSAEKHKESVENKSLVYRRNKKDKLKKDLNTNLSMKVPGGGLQSTVGDLLRFGEAVINHELISKETMQLMVEDPGIRPKEAGNPYGMGWFLYDKNPERRVIGHSGGQAGTTTQLMILPDQGIVVACISNTRGGDNWGKVMNFTWKMIDYAVNPSTLNDPILQPVSISIQAMDKMVGAYNFGKAGVLELYRKGNQLYSDLNQYKRLKLYPAKENMIFYRNSPAQFEFVFNEKGQVTKTIYTQNGKEFFPEKIR